jgi:hypothetical protein
MICLCSSERHMRQICQLKAITGAEHAPIHWPLKQQIPAHCKETPNQTTMARAPLNPLGPVKEKAWKVRHQGVICMLAKEVGPIGRLSHELIQRVKVKFSYCNDKSVHTLWKKYKQPILRPITALRSSAAEHLTGTSSIQLMTCNTRSETSRWSKERHFEVCRMLQASSMSPSTTISVEA